MDRTCRQTRTIWLSHQPSAPKASQVSSDHSTAHGSQPTNCDPRASGPQPLCHLILVAKWTETKLLTGKSEGQMTENNQVLCKDDMNAFLPGLPPSPGVRAGSQKREVGSWRLSYSSSGQQADSRKLSVEGCTIPRASNRSRFLCPLNGGRNELLAAVQSCTGIQSKAQED